MNGASGRVCTFFLSGSCRFGSSCRFEHPSGADRINGSRRNDTPPAYGNQSRTFGNSNFGNTSTQSASGGQQASAFGALQPQTSAFGSVSAFGTPTISSRFGGTDGSSAFGSAPVGGSPFGSAQVNPFGASRVSEQSSAFGATQASAFGSSTSGGWSGGHNAIAAYPCGGIDLTIASLKEDLSAANIPVWKFSSYGPARHESNLITGLDVSPEELRLSAVEAAKAQTVNAYVQHENTLLTQADSAFHDVRTNLGQALQQAERNRKAARTANLGIAAVGSSTLSAVPAAGSTFGGSAFGQPASGSAVASAFGQTSAFGQPAQTGGGHTGSAFDTQTSAFGSALTAGGSAFPQGSAFANPSTTTVPTPGFGQGISSAFGASQGSAFSQTPSAFAANSVPPVASAFGTASSFGIPPNNTPAIAPQSAFGAIATSEGPPPPYIAPPPYEAARITGTAASPSVFGTPSAFGAVSAPSAQSRTSAFGPPVSAFGTATQQHPSGSFMQGPSPSAATTTGGAQTAAADVAAQTIGRALLDVYARLTPSDGPAEDVTSGARLAFQADTFEWANIPSQAPPMELR